MLSIVPGPVRTDEVVEWHVFARPFNDGMCGCAVVAKLYVGVGE